MLHESIMEVNGKILPIVIRTPTRSTQSYHGHVMGRIPLSLHVVPLPRLQYTKTNRSNDGRIMHRARTQFKRVNTGLSTLCNGFRTPKTALTTPRSHDRRRALRLGRLFDTHAPLVREYFLGRHAVRGPVGAASSPVILALVHL